MSLEARSAASLELHELSGEHLARVAVAAPVMIWDSDGAPDRRTFSAAWRAFTGGASDGGRAWLEHVHPEDSERCKGILAASLQARAAFTLDYRVLNRDGHYRWVMDSASPRTHDGSFAGYAGVCIDIHERRRLEDDLAERTRTLRLGAQRRDDFLSALAHEVRNPLAPIVNAAALLRMMEKDTPRLARIRDIIERQGETLKRLANDLSDMTRLASHHVSVRRETVPVQALIAAAVDSVELALHHAGHAVKVTPSEMDLQVRVDPARVQQALANLVSNAGKFMSQPGTIHIDASADARTLSIRVTDAGEGIAADALPRVFDVWGPHEHPLPRTTGGLGVGLAIARRIARLHGGDIRGHSEGAGRGAVFVMTLPLQD